MAGKSAGADIRCIKTKNAIQKALLELLEDKDIQSITIKELADRAMINRKTFYAHYDNVEQVVDEIAMSIVDEMMRALDDVEISAQHFDPLECFARLTSLVEANVNEYHFLMAPNCRSLILRMKQELKERLVKPLSQELNIPPRHLDYALEFLTTGALAVYQQWFNSDRQESLQQLSALIGQLTSNGLSALL